MPKNGENLDFLLVRRRMESYINLIEPLSGRGSSRSTPIDLVEGSDPQNVVDLTGDNSDDEPKFMGIKFSTTTVKRMKEIEKKQRREEAVRREEWRRRNGFVGGDASGSITRPGSTASASGGTSSHSGRSSRTQSAGPSSSIRPEINYLGTNLLQNTLNRHDSEPPRKKQRRRDRTHCNSTHTRNPGFTPEVLDLCSPSPPKAPPRPQPEPTSRTAPTWDEYAYENEPMFSDDPEPEREPAPMHDIPQQQTDDSDLPSFEDLMEPDVHQEVQVPRPLEVKMEEDKFTPKPLHPDPQPMADLEDYEDQYADVESNPDSDQDCDCVQHDDVFDLENPRWKPPKSLKEDEIAADLQEKCSLNDHDWEEEDYHDRGFDTLRGEKYVTPPYNMVFVWDMYKKFKKRASAGKRRQKPTKSILDPGYGKVRHPGKAMRKQTSFKVNPGAINRIEQCSGWLAIACSRPGEEVDPYGFPGSLFVWNQEEHVLPGHSRLKSSYQTRRTNPQTNEEKDVEMMIHLSSDDDGTDHEPLFRKHYTVTDVKFNKSGDCFLSAGMDEKVKVWERREEMYAYSHDLDIYRSGVPYDIAFQPGNGVPDVVAVATKDVHVYSSVSDLARNTKIVLPSASDIYPNHNTGSILWDTNKPHILYSSSEPDNESSDGVHRAFDVNKARPILRFNVNEGGDAMTVDQLAVLALATQAEGGNFLRLFDIKNLNGSHMQKITLEPFHFTGKHLDQQNPEINSMTFSPDGIYLALARMDNSVHVYDSRMLSRGVLHIYRHKPPPIYHEKKDYHGVFNAEWITTRSGQYVLLSGGEDGCIRLWKPMWSAKEPTNGEKIVELNSEIGTFSVGDPFRGEYELVVGESTGEVSIFTGLLNYL
ncbi:Rik1-associated factor 1 [Leucoagaricus sp. SymC.cos]|nr:Rik1-associated factor 1 [Leucoagaricus sp. SymC.cos]